MVGAIPLKVVPSDSVPEMFPGPVTAKDKVAAPPLQIVVIPLIEPVGRGLIVISTKSLTATHVPTGSLVVIFNVIIPLDIEGVKVEFGKLISEKLPLGLSVHIELAVFPEYDAAKLTILPAHTV